VLRLGVELIIRWASALPVRRALALQQFGRNGLDEDKARAMLSEEPRDFLIELAGVPHALINSEVEQHLRKARLSVPGRRPLTPLSVEVPTIGRLVTARMTFPRAAGLSADAGAIRFRIESDMLPVVEEFKLRSMVYEGRLEL
jgi:hypothetical protein